MNEKEDWIVNGFQFGSEADAKQAQLEEQKIIKLEEKMNYKNPDIVLMIYKKALDNRIFKTLVGYEYLRKLQKYLTDNPFVREPVKPIPVPGVFNVQDFTSAKRAIRNANAEVEKVKRMQRESEAFFSRKMSIYVNILLLILVIVMFVLTLTSNRPNILNYENNLQNKYAAWEQELKEREAAVLEREKQQDQDME